MLLVMVLNVLLMVPTEAKIVANGVPLSQYNANGNQQNGDQQNGDQQNGNQQNGDQQNGNQQNGDQQNGNQQNGDQQNGDQQNGNQQNGDQQNNNIYLTGALKVSNEKNFRPYRFDISNVDRFLAKMLEEDGGRYITIDVFSNNSIAICRIEERIKELGLIIHERKVLKEKDIKPVFLKTLTSIWKEEEPIIGVRITIKDESKASAMQKALKNPIFRFGASLTGFSSLLDAGEMVASVIK
jgi:hypothetical protein